MTIATLPAHFTGGDYAFTRVTSAALPKIRGWLGAGHLGDWWTPTGEELGAVAAGDDPGRTAYLVAYDGWAFAYLQLTDIAFDPVFSEQLSFPPGTLRVDQFIGDAAMIGFGHGIKFLKGFVDSIAANGAVKKLVALPSDDNFFAVRTYSQAGFRLEKTLETPVGTYSAMGLIL